MNIMNIQDYVVVTIAIFTYLVLAMIKPFMPSRMRKFIPLIAGVIGILANLWLNGWLATFPIVLEGLASGLSATGIDQLIKQSTGYYDEVPEPVLTDDGE